MNDNTNTDKVIVVDMLLHFIIFAGYQVFSFIKQLNFNGISNLQLSKTLIMGKKT